MDKEKLFQAPSAAQNSQSRLDDLIRTAIGFQSVGVKSSFKAERLG